MNISRTDHDFSMKWRNSQTVSWEIHCRKLSFLILILILKAKLIFILFFPSHAFQKVVVLTILTGKNCFYSIQYKNVCLAASDLFNMFTQSIKFFAFHYHVLKSRDVCMVHQIDSKNEWLLLPASFTAKFGLVFVLTWKTLFLRGFILKPTERA